MLFFSLSSRFSSRYKEYIYYQIGEVCCNVVEGIVKKFARSGFFKTSLLAVAFTIPLGVPEVYATIMPEITKSSCSDAHEVCKKVTLDLGDKTASTDFVYIPAGKTVYFSIYNTGGTFQIGAKVFKEAAGEVANTTLSASANGGTDGGFFVSTGGNYFIQVISGDYTSPYTATGEGFIYYYID